MERFILTEEQAGERLDALLPRFVPALTRSAAQKLLQSGAVAVNGAPVRKNYRAAAGDAVELTLPEPEESAAEPEDIPLDIVYEDADVIAVNKPRGMVVHPAPGHSSGTLVNALLFHCGDSLSGVGGEKRPGIVHRIDMDTSGLLIAAKNDAAHLSLSAQLADHSMFRIYEAVVIGRLREDHGTVNAPIGRHPVDRKRMAVVARGGARVYRPFGVERDGAFIVKHQRRQRKARDGGERFRNGRKFEKRTDEALDVCRGHASEGVKPSAGFKGFQSLAGFGLGDRGNEGDVALEKARRHAAHPQSNDRSQHGVGFDGERQFPAGGPHGHRLHPDAAESGVRSELRNGCSQGLKTGSDGGRVFDVEQYAPSIGFVRNAVRGHFERHRHADAFGGGNGFFRSRRRNAGGKRDAVGAQNLCEIILGENEAATSLGVFNHAPGSVRIPGTGGGTRRGERRLSKDAFRCPAREREHSGRGRRRRRDRKSGIGRRVFKIDVRRPETHGNDGFAGRFCGVCQGCG